MKLSLDTKMLYPLQNLVSLLIVLSRIHDGQSTFSCRQHSIGHITCQPRNSFCHITDDHYLSTQEQQEILEAHNRMRREAAKGLLKRYGLPEASNMRKMEWDDELANNAQAHVEVKCQLQHDQARQRKTSEFSYVGQNIYITQVWNQQLVEDTWSDVVQTFWGKDEALKLRSDTFGSGLTLQGHDLKTIGHLTQILWAETDKVGCGKIIFDSQGGTADLRTCDYGEGGNVIGGAMYATGPACSACPETHPYCDDGLCSKTPSYGYSPSTHYSQTNDASAYQNSASYNWWEAPRQSATYYNTPSTTSTQFYQNTYNYKDYTVLRRRKRSSPGRLTLVL